MLTAFHARNYGCLKDVKLGLTPLHAFIGPNDSGKSTILDGIRACLSATRRTAAALGTLFQTGADGSMLGAFAGDGGRYVIRTQGAHIEEETTFGAQVLVRPRNPNSGSVFYGDSKFGALVEKFGTASTARFDPAAMRAASLVADNAVDAFLQNRGHGLAAVLATLQLRGDDAFDAIRREMLSAFPTLKTIGTKPIGNGNVVLRAELKDGAEVDASRLSEGIYYYLGFQILKRAVTAQTTLLVEEPENGLHPSRIKDVVKTLREISEAGTQVFLATHSPLVVNELAAGEVTVVTRPSAERGTVVTPISTTPNFEKRSSVYSLGELWLSYADGKTEEPLLSGKE